MRGGGGGVISVLYQKCYFYTPAKKIKIFNPQFAYDNLNCHVQILYKNITEYYVLVKSKMLIWQISIYLNLLPSPSIFML